MLAFSASSQLLEDNSNLYIQYQKPHFLGGNTFNNHSVVAPSFYTNFSEANSISIKNIYKFKPNISIGASANYLSANDWNYNNYSTYKYSKAQLITISPLIQYHTRFQENGFFYRLKIFGELAPVFGVSFAELNGSKVFEISPAIKSLKSNDIIYGIKTLGGLEYSLTNGLGLIADVSFQPTFVNSPLYIDNKILLWNLGLGLKFNINKIRRFNY